MTKKILSLILLITLMLTLFSGTVVCTAAQDLVERNLAYKGHMEWNGTSYGGWSNEYDTTIKHSGEKSLRVTVDDSRAMLRSDFHGLVPGETYTLSYYVYQEELLQPSTNWPETGYYSYRSAISIETPFYNANGTLVRFFDEFVPEVTNTWIHRTMEFLIPATAGTDIGYLQVYIRPQGTGTLWYDDIEITGNTTADYAVTLDETVSSYEEGYEISENFYNTYLDTVNSAVLAPGASNLLKNPGFETTGSDASGASYWAASAFESEVVVRDTSEKYSGSASMKLHIPKTYASPYIPFVLQDVYETYIADTQYIVSAWVKMKDMPRGQGFFVKATCTASDTTYDISSRELYFEDEEWHKINFLFTMPENVSKVQIALRHQGKGGTMWFDDIVFGQADTNRHFEMISKRVFYYTDEESFDVWTDFKTNNRAIENGSTMKFTLSDSNGREVASSQAYPTAKENRHNFSLNLMNLEEKYILKAEYLSSSGEVIESYTKDIYRYNRPTLMDKEGNFLDESTGKPIYPFFMYTANYTVYNSNNTDLSFHQAAANAGLTVIRPEVYPTESENKIRAYLDSIHAQGKKALVQLYTNVAGHPAQLPTTKKVVTAFKDHPAVAAWMVMDEPSAQITQYGIRTFDEMLHYIEEAYKAIRAIDKKHPVFCIETVGEHLSIERTAQLCDIFSIDHYPKDLEASISGSMTSLTQRAINAVYNERPVWVLGLAAEWSAYGRPINSSMLRYQLYDALWSGAKGAGHYLKEPSAGADPSYSQIYLETFTKAKNSGEIDEIFDHFSLGNSEVFNEGSGAGYQWRAWYKTNGDIYLALRSRNTTGEVLDNVTASINLVNKAGMSVDGYVATLVNGVSEGTVVSNDSKFTATITAGEVSLYKIIPNEDMNFDTSVPVGDIRPVEYGDELVADENFISVPVKKNRYYELSFNANPAGFNENDVTPKVKIKYIDWNNQLISEEEIILYNMFASDDIPKENKIIFRTPVNVSTCSILFTPRYGKGFVTDVSLKEIVAYNESQHIINASFEFFDNNDAFTNANGTCPANWQSTSPANVAISTDANNGNFSVGLIGNASISTSVPIEYGRTYEVSAYFNAKDLTNADSYPSIEIETRNSQNAYNVSTGSVNVETMFEDAYLNKNRGWVKLTTEITIPAYKTGYDLTSMVVSLNMNGSGTGYFDSASVMLKSDEMGYNINNLIYSTTLDSVILEYDVINTFKDENGVLVYAFYDSQGKLIKVESEPANFTSIHNKKVFTKFGFFAVKIFIWDALNGLTPYSNVCSNDVVFDDWIRNTSGIYGIQTDIENNKTVYHYNPVIVPSNTPQGWVDNNGSLLGIQNDILNYKTTYHLES